MYNRSIGPILLKAATGFPAVFLTGPRQSGKTTLLKSLFPDHNYLSLETPSTLALVQEDPLSFFSKSDKKWVIDEAQNFPALFSYLQGIIDEIPIPGRFILSGSQNFLMHEKISQTLAGRVAILELLPPSFEEMEPHLAPVDMDPWTYMFYGSYPRPRYESLEYSMWFDSYIRTYLERDIRSLVNVHDLKQFQRFIMVCAAHHGQLLNLSELGASCGISQTTARDWLTYLETSYIVYRLQPFYRNFKKRLTKTPRLFFYDSGLVCHLLRIESPEKLSMHAMRGFIFEGLMNSEIIKAQLNSGKQPSLYFWRDHRGLEIDAVIDNPNEMEFIEFKSSQTFHAEYLDNLKKLQVLTEGNPATFRLVYTGEDAPTLNNISIQNWRGFLQTL